MILRCPGAFSWNSASPLRVLRMLMLLSLLLTALAHFAKGKTTGVEVEPFIELRCTCVKTTSRIHPNYITNLEVMKAGAHCPVVEVIATLKDGRKTCLNPEAPIVKKMIQKILEGDELAA